MIFNRVAISALVICLLYIAGVVGYNDYCGYSQLNFVLDMESSQPGVVQVFFDVGRGYNEQDSYSIRIQGRNQQKCVFPLSSKVIKSIRFDPIDVSAVVRIKDARIEDKQGNVIKKIPLRDFRPIQQINKMDTRDGTLVIHTIENANDPIMLIENSFIGNQVIWHDYIVKRGWIIIGYGLLILLFFTGLFYFVMNKYVAENLKKRIVFIELISAIAFSLLVVARWWYYVDAYSVNILYWDQWHLYDAFVKKKNLWELFRWQPGPHRMGVGFIVTKVVASLSGWNTRAEAFAIGGAVCLAMVAALALRARLGPRLTWADTAIPLIFLTPIQYEIFAGAPFPSLGAVPLLLLTLYSLVWAAWRGFARCGAILTLNFLLIYTGYGVFVGMITPCLFGAEALHAHRAHDRKGLWLALTGVAVSLLSAGSFFVGFRFIPGVDGFQFPIREWWRYLQFMALMLANFCGIKGVMPLSYVVGFLILFLMATLAIVHAVRTLRPRAAAPESPTDAVIAVLTVFTLIFCANTAIGRISMGLPIAQSSRYVTNMIPGFLGIYLWLAALPPGVLRRLLLAVAVVGLIAASFPLREADHGTLNWYSQGKSRWKAAYLQTEDIGAATRAANFLIDAAPESVLKQRLKYLKRERLNLYLDASSLHWSRYARR